ncbi:MAG: hypothetical protein JNL02_08790 [Saprospiraceae bacterium]|nr:hypothetical protein [Saprospiraceae bacterium]MCC7507273.1 hypothetical protein [Saprospiraceae bacterium]
MKRFFLLLALPLLLHSCASWQQNKWLAAHRANLTRIANSSMSPEQKMDGLIEDYLQFIREDLKFVDPRKGIKYVQKYHDQNEAAMNKILGEAERWQSNLDMVGKASLAVRIAQKPYLDDLMDLGPKFKRKYNQYAFVAKMSAKIGGGLGKLAGKALGL